MSSRILAGLCLAGLTTVSAAALAQSSAVSEFGEVPGVKGKATAAVNVEPGSYATLIATAQVRGGQPVGQGVLTRAGIGVDIYVGEEICAADRDIRRQIDVAKFEGQFATSATCMKVLGPGKHTILAEKTNINVDGSKMVLKYTILGGKPDKLSAAQ